MSVKIPIHHNVFHESNPREIKSVDNVFGNFLVNSGLYDTIEITQENIYELADLIGGHVKIDVYCPECGDNRVFTCEAVPYYSYNDRDDEIQVCSLDGEIISWQEVQKLVDSNPEKEHIGRWSWSNNTIENDTRLIVFKFVCAMDQSHHLNYIVLTKENILQKIGQYPSVADLSFPELSEYRKVMSKEDEKEIKRAIGLFASGIGIGSFVYLRRVFERIIVSASRKAIAAGKIEEDTYNKARIDEKIKLLSDYLPKSLVDNKVFYGIVSKGIHELSEEECITYFLVLKNCILMILRQWDKMRRDEEEEKQIAASLSQIATRVKDATTK